MGAASFEIDSSRHKQASSCISSRLSDTEGHISTRKSGTDLHLVMNAFNRMVGNAAFNDLSACEQVFDLSDYLRLCVVYSQPVEVRLQDEIALLRCYLRLAARFRGWALDVQMTVPPGLTDRRLQAHSICLLAQAALNAYGIDTPGSWSMAVQLHLLPDNTLEINASLRPFSPQPAPRLRRVERELEELCSALSTAGRPWHHRAACLGQGEVQIIVNVR